MPPISNRRRRRRWPRKPADSRPIHRGVFQFVGFDVLAPQVNCAVARLGDNERAAMLDAWRQRVAGLAHEAPINVGSY